MEGHLVAFNEMVWQQGGKGLRFKAFTYGYQRIRLMELREEFEGDWCMSGHVGYLIEGELSVRFEETIEWFKKGDTVFIPQGIEHKHKVSVTSGEKVLILSLETVRENSVII